MHAFVQDLSASLCFRGQRLFIHNASGWFGSVPLEASGDFGIHPEEGEFHLMCQVCLISDCYMVWIVSTVHGIPGIMLSMKCSRMSDLFLKSC